MKAVGSALSNPPGGPLGGAPLYRPAAPQELPAALGLVLGSALEPADPAQVADFIRFAQHRGINAAGVWLADVGGSLAWAVLPIVSPGRTMLLLGPGLAPVHPLAHQAAGHLIDGVCAHFAGRVQLAQVLLEPGDAAAHRLYEGHGFQRIAQLVYLQVAPRRKAPPPVLPPGMNWETYAPESHAVFARSIAETYRQSLDCPRLNGLRNIEDVLAGHKATGDFEPRLWAVLRDADGPLGALLLSRAAPGDTMELVYLGLTPAARGRGLGDVMMRRALALTAQDGAARLSLAVDSENLPALKLYYRHGMQRVGAKLALMRQLTSAAG